MMLDVEQLAGVTDANEVLQELAAVFFQNVGAQALAPSDEPDQPNVDARYRALVEQIPAVVFMAYLDRGIGEAYVSPQIEASLGFTQAEWLEDPVRWFSQIHPDDKARWSLEAAQMFLSGKPLRSAYRVIARNGRVVWFHCEAKMIRRDDGRPWFIHGVAFDITELKQVEQALQEERNVLSAILDTVGALVMVLDQKGRIVRFNRACEHTTGYFFDEVKNQYVWDLFLIPEEFERYKAIFDQLGSRQLPSEYESFWNTRNGSRRLIAWSSKVLTGRSGAVGYIIATGIDITEQKHLEAAVLDVSAREQRRIAQDLHDGLGQHLTGIAFLSKVLERRLAEKESSETADASKIVTLVNQAIHKTRELAKGLLPVMSDTHGLMSALHEWAAEVEDVFEVACRFECPDPVLIHDDGMATQLYHIAREAVINAVKHGKSKRVIIQLSATSDGGVLTVTDDGTGLSQAPPGHTGMGLRIMNYRAKMMGGSLDVQGNPESGTRVTCVFPIR